jgi:hypothetical protein
MERVYSYSDFIASGDEDAIDKGTGPGCLSPKRTWRRRREAHSFVETGAKIMATREGAARAYGVDCGEICADL